MLTNFFGNSKPINAIVLTGLFLVFFILGFFTDKIALSWFVIPLFLVVFGLVNFINSKNKLTFDNSFTFLFYVLLIGFFSDLVKINTTFFANLTLLLSLRKIYSIQSSKAVFVKLFDAGFWLGITFLLEPFSLLFILMLYVAVFLHQQLNWQTLMIPIVGCSIPLVFFFTYCFWNDTLVKFESLFYVDIYQNFDWYLEYSHLFSMIFIGVFVLISLFLKTPKALSVKNKFRKNWILILLNLVLGVILILVVKKESASELLYVLLPTAVILANGFELVQKKFFADLILALFFIGGVATYFW